MQVGGREQTLRVLGSVNTLKALRDFTIPTGSGGYVKLTDIAEVGDGSSEVRGFARLNGQPVVGFMVMKTRDSSDVAVEDNIIAALQKAEGTYKGVTFTKIFSSVDETRASFRATQHVLLEGMILAALVVFLFLRDWRSTAITAFAMPVSLIPTFFFMNVFGFSLNVVTLLALTLVIGILVDDAIVEIENIEKRVAGGMRPFQAAMEVRTPSAWPSWRPPSPSSWCSRRSRSWPAWPGSSSASSASRCRSRCCSHWWSRGC